MKNCCFCNYKDSFNCYVYGYTQINTFWLFLFFLSIFLSITIYFSFFFVECQYYQSLSSSKSCCDKSRTPFWKSPSSPVTLSKQFTIVVQGPIRGTSFTFRFVYMCVQKNLFSNNSNKFISSVCFCICFFSAILSSISSSYFQRHNVGDCLPCWVAQPRPIFDICRQKGEQWHDSLAHSLKWKFVFWKKKKENMQLHSLAYNSMI